MSNTENFAPKLRDYADRRQIRPKILTPNYIQSKSMIYMQVLVPHTGLPDHY